MEIKLFKRIMFHWLMFLHVCFWIALLLFYIEQSVDSKLMIVFTPMVFGGVLIGVFVGAHYFSRFLIWFMKIKVK